MAAASLLLASCRDGLEPARIKAVSVRAQLPEQLTRVTAGDLTGGLYPLLWQEGDVISVNGVLSNALQANFSGSSDAVFSFGNLSTSSPYNMLCPGSAAGTITIDGNAPALYARSTSLSDVAAFHHLTAGIQVQLTGSLSLSSLELSSAGAEVLGGTFSVSFTDGSLSAVSPRSSLSRSFSPARALSSGEPLTLLFFIAPGTFTGGLVLTATASDATVCRWYFGGGQTLQKGKIYAVSQVAFVPDVPNLPDDTDPIDLPDGFTVSLEEIEEVTVDYQL